MVIKTDVSNIPLHKAPLSRKAPDLPVARNSNESRHLSPKNISDRLRIERSLGDALSIAQMSQNVIQKAISISQRLKSIATSAMASGSVNIQALTEALNDIRSSIAPFGEQVPNPVQPATTPSAKIFELPDIRGALSSVSDIAAGLQKGDYAQSARIEAVNRNLNEFLAGYRISENRITDLMRETTAGYAPSARVTSGELVRHITSAIELNPGNAISAQGNITPAVAERLMA